MSESYEEVRANAIAALESGDSESAFRTFRSAIDYRSQMLDGSESQFADAFGVFARISESFAPPDFVSIVRAVSEQPGNVQALYDLGYALYEQGLQGIGATPLARADQLAPGTPGIIAELVTSLESCNACELAVEVLRKYPELTSQQFLPAYQLAFNSIMIGDVPAARDAFEVASRLAADTEDETFMTARIRRFLNRAQQLESAAPLDRGDLRGWHYVIAGGILTQLSPFGFPDPMQGRYAMLQDACSTIRVGIENLHRIVQTKNVAANSVMALEDRGSQIVAAAVGAKLGLPVREWSQNESLANTIVVAYDISMLEDASPCQRLRERAPGQLLFSHALCWVQSFPITPDVISILHQINTPPWEPQLRVDPDTNQPGYSDADERPVQEIASEILTSTGDPSEGGDGQVPELTDAFLAAVGAFPSSSGIRETFWESSPVKSARFA